MTTIYLASCLADIPNASKSLVLYPDPPGGAGRANGCATAPAAIAATISGRSPKGWN